MGLFRFNYAKPGKGVEKDEPEQTGLAKFFTIFFRRLSKFVQLNLLFFVNLLITLVLMGALYFVPYFLNFGSLPAINFGTFAVNLYNFYVVPLPLILFSVLNSGIMVVARRLTNKEYVFIWTEYKQGVKDNWKQFLINGVVCYLAFVFLSFSLMFYGAKTVESGGFFYVPFILLLIITVVFVLSQYYVPVMMVSVNMKMKPIYRNSMIFSIMGLWRNIVISAVLVGVFLLYNYLLPTMVLTLLLIVFILPSFLIYTMVYLTYPMVNNYVIQPFYKKEGEGAPDKLEEQDKKSEEEELFSRVRSLSEEELEENKSEYVYINGKLVKREELEESEDPDDPGMDE